MSWLKKWDLGAKAYDVMVAAGDFLRDLDLDALLAVVAKVIAIEADPQFAGSGQGGRKAKALVDWYLATYSGARYAGALSRLSQFAAALVALFNVVQVFRK